MWSLPAQEVAESLGGIQTYRFWKTVPKEQDFEAYQKQDSDSLPIREGTIIFVCEVWA